LARILTAAVLAEVVVNDGCLVLAAIEETGHIMAEGLKRPQPNLQRAITAVAAVGLATAEATGSAAIAHAAAAEVWKLFGAAQAETAHGAEGGDAEQQEEQPARGTEAPQGEYENDIKGQELEQGKKDKKDDNGATEKQGKDLDEVLGESSKSESSRADAAEVKGIGFIKEQSKKKKKKKGKRNKCASGDDGQPTAAKQQQHHHQPQHEEEQGLGDQATEAGATEAENAEQKADVEEVPPAEAKKRVLKVQWSDATTDVGSDGDGDASDWPAPYSHEY